MFRARGLAASTLNAALAVKRFVPSSFGRCRFSSSCLLGIESSCDESGAAVIEEQTGRIVCDLVASQWELVSEYGGVVPSLAARQHSINLPKLVKEALASTSHLDLAAVAVTTGPGLAPCLQVGLDLAKQLARERNVPLVAVNHIEAHMLSAMMVDPALRFPFLALVISGGHTQLVLCRGIGRHDIIGRTCDDSIGEAFDKAARVLHIVPGKAESAGAAIERAAALYNSDGQRGAGDQEHVLPEAMLRRKDCDFSFSGLKSSLRRLVAKEFGHEPNIPIDSRNELAFKFQDAAVRQLQRRTRRALQLCAQHLAHEPIQALVLTGGVACNNVVRQRLESESSKHGVRFVCPPVRLCTDNAAMIAWTGLQKWRLGHRDPLSIDCSDRWPVGPKASWPEQTKKAERQSTNDANEAVAAPLL